MKAIGVHAYGQPVAGLSPELPRAVAMPYLTKLYEASFAALLS
jgi:hypothetical protein